MPLNIDAQFEGKMTCTFKSDMRNLTNMYSLKLMNSNFDKTFTHV